MKIPISKAELDDFEKFITTLPTEFIPKGGLLLPVWEVEIPESRQKQLVKTAYSLIELAERTGWQSVPEFYESIQDKPVLVLKHIIVNHTQFQNLVDKYREVINQV